MRKDKFNEIIDFAIDREKEAVRFYQDLQKKAKFAQQLDMLKDLEQMEKGHIKILDGFRKKGAKKVKPKEKEIQDLQISDYLVEKEPTEDMDYQDILIIAMKREEASTKLYKDLAQKVGDEESQKLFERLSQEEAGHKLKFETLYDEEILKEN